MSTKFRQCLILLCEDCRRSAKGQHSAVVLFGRSHTVKQVLGAHRPVGGRTISSTERVSFHHHHASQPPEGKSLLAVESLTQAKESPKISFY